MIALALLFAADAEPMAGSLEIKHDGAVLAVAFSSDGKRLATATGKGAVAVWDAASGKPLVKTEGHKSAVRSIALSRDGKRLATADEDGRLVLWDAATGKRLAEAGHESEVRAVAFSPDGKAIYAAVGGSVHRFDVKLVRGKPIRVADFKGSLHHVAVSPDGKKLLASSQTTLNEGSSYSAYCRVDLATGKVEVENQSKVQPADKRERWQSHRAQAVWSPDGKASARVEEEGVRWGKVTIPGEGVVGLAFAIDGKALLTADRDGLVMLTTEKGSKRLKGQGPILALTLSPDGKRFALARADGNLVVKPQSALE